MATNEAEGSASAAIVAPALTVEGNHNDQKAQYLAQQNCSFAKKHKLQYNRVSGLL